MSRDYVTFIPVLNCANNVHSIFLVKHSFTNEHLQRLIKQQHACYFFTLCTNKQ